MIVGIGVDICDITRLRRLRQRYGQRFLERVFSPAERAYCGEGATADQRYAVRFAAKEACLKALGTGFSGGITLQNVEIVTNTSGRPELHVSGVAKQVWERLGVESAHVSLSHEREQAIAFVVLER